MPIVVKNTLNEIRSSAMGGGGRAEKAKRLAELIRKLGEYRWVGVYDVGAEMVSIIAWSGPSAPENPSFPASKGLTGAAIQQKKAVVVGDVRDDPRCLAASGGTLSGLIVPVLSPDDRANAFSAADQQMIEQCAEAALPLWLLA